MNRAALQTLIACALALVAGIDARNLRAISPRGEKTSPLTKNAAAEAPPANDPLALAMKTATGAKRWLLLVSAAEKATARDDDAAVRMLATHWAGLDPKQMFT